MQHASSSCCGWVRTRSSLAPRTRQLAAALTAAALLGRRRALLLRTSTRCVCVCVVVLAAVCSCVQDARMVMPQHGHGVLACAPPLMRLWLSCVRACL
jgi:hypothetical protein